MFTYMSIDIDSESWPAGIPAADSSEPGGFGATIGSAAAAPDRESQDSTDNSSTQPKGRSRPAGRGSARGEKAKIVRAAALALAIDAAPSVQRGILSAMYGVKNDPVALTVAAETGAPGSASDDLLALIDADPMEAGLMAAELGADKVRVRALWSLLLVLGAVKGEPAKEAAKVGLAMARAAHKLDDSVRADLAAVLALVG